MPSRPFPTHFLSIPLVNATSRAQLTSSLASFAADVTSPDSYGVPAGAIRPVGTLHLTLGVMSFPKNEGLEKAVELLNTLVPSRILASVRPHEPIIIETRPTEIGESSPPSPPFLSVTLKGLLSMQSASKATVLYSPPADSEQILQKFCEKIKAIFQEAGLMMDENDRPLLLHATILNTVYVKGGRHGKRREKLTIDARGILDRYDDFVWVEDVPIMKIAICKMGAKKQEDGDEAYEVESEIDMMGPE